MSAIGILGGMGPQASSKLVELIIANTPNFVAEPTDSDFPEIIHLSIPVPNFISNKDNMQKAKDILIERTKLLEAAGSTINCIACNTAHLLLPELQAATKVPFLSIPKLVAERISASGFERVGLLATPNTLASTLFDDELGEGVTLVRPNLEIVNEIERLIFKQLSGSLSIKERRCFRNLVAVFKTTNDLEGVILGCTELPLVFGETNDKTILSTLEILADALLTEHFNKK